jgi:mitogen-activated protein kinase 1/3
MKKLDNLFFQRPLFPGKHYIEQINLILNVVGSPNEGDLTSISKFKIPTKPINYNINLFS